MKIQDRIMAWGIIISLIVSCSYPPTSRYVLPTYSESYSMENGMKIDCAALEMGQSLNFFSFCFSLHSDSALKIPLREISAFHGNDTLNAVLSEIWHGGKSKGIPLIYPRSQPVPDKNGFMLDGTVALIGERNFASEDSVAIPSGENGLCLLFADTRNVFNDSVKLSLPFGVNMSNQIVCEFIPQKMIMCVPDRKWSKWMEKTVIHGNDSVNVYVLRQFLEKDMHEIQCMILIEDDDILIRHPKNKGLYGNHKQGRHNYTINPRNAIFHVSDPAFSLEVVRKSCYRFIKPYYEHWAKYHKVPHVLFTLKRKDGGVIDHIPYISLLPCNIIQIDGLPLLTDTIFLNE